MTGSPVVAGTRENTARPTAVLTEATADTDVAATADISAMIDADRVATRGRGGVGSRGGGPPAATGHEVPRSFIDQSRRSVNWVPDGDVTVVVTVALSLGW